MRHSFNHKLAARGRKGSLLISVSPSHTSTILDISSLSTLLPLFPSYASNSCPLANISCIIFTQVLARLSDFSYTCFNLSPYLALLPLVNNQTDNINIIVLSLSYDRGHPTPTPFSRYPLPSLHNKDHKLYHTRHPGTAACKLDYRTWPAPGYVQRSTLDLRNNTRTSFACTDQVISTRSGCGAQISHLYTLGSRWEWRSGVISHMYHAYNVRSDQRFNFSRLWFGLCRTMETAVQVLPNKVLVTPDSSVYAINEKPKSGRVSQLGGYQVGPLLSGAESGENLQNLVGADSIDRFSLFGGDSGEATDTRTVIISRQVLIGHF
ncbi:hypothetical protein RRG08_055722 [Elysia crispata]|uniref:Uncharacterized protein n=1 Tax=Elysia crispata TaxID=231223 RepID=A0AAE1E8L1_9GAST|nr:hypothetical protein RRG08_055722 [Elysia crispata]